MICNVCGGSESYIQDGIEYCRECSEQIKGSIDEDAGEGVCIKKSLLSSPVTKKKRKEKGNALSPWLHSEAYNLILFKQVSALIKLGCSEKLKTVVFSLWARYLQKCESAFIASSKKEFIPRLSVFPSKRDIELLYGEGIYTNMKEIKRPYFKKKKHATSKKSKRKVTQKIPKTEPVDSAISNSEVSGDESTDSSLHNVLKMKKKKKLHILYSFHARKLKKKGYKRTSSVAQEICVSHMTLAKTLSFCQLGLLYTEDWMLLFDLIRLINEDAVPFIDVARYFPTTMQLQSSDFQFFQIYHTPDIKKISSTSAQLIDFLQLPKFKHPPLLPIAIRFVKDLNLPCELIPVLKLLINKINKNSDEHKRRMSSIPPYEAQALSVVAVALKMLFVLDGKFEVEHSEVMTKLNSISENKTFFVWKDWQKQMSLKEYLFFKRFTLKNNAMNLLDILSADRINGNFPVDSIHQELTTLASQSSKNIYTTRNELKTLFEHLVNDSSTKKRPTSFPLQYELQYLMNGWRKLPLFKDTENIDFNFISKDFSHHKLYYRPSVTTSEPMSLLLSFLYESVKLFHISDQEEYFENIIRTSNKYWYINHTFHDFKSRKWENDFPSSFKWLFNFMCNYLQFDKLDFYKEFKYIEHILIKI